jgi:hypothetical protein
MKSAAVLVWIALMSVSGCASAGDRPSSGDPSSADEPSSTREPSATDADEFTLPSGSGPNAKSISPGGPTALTGALTFDDIEGGCSYLQVADGTKFEVIYPEGWMLDRAGAVLRGPAGQLARAGAAVSVTGSLAGGRSSICQVGPIFEATAVEIPEG